jgi:glycosyltransferase involved in cell wall biosynthesis
MRLLQAMSGTEFGGAEAFFTRLAIALARAGVEQHAVIRRSSARAEVLQRGGVQSVQLPFRGRLDFYTSFAFKREIKSFAPDVVLTWMNRATSHCPTGDFTHVGRLGGYYDLKYYRNCQHLIGNTGDIVDYVVRAGWPQDRVHCLPNFVNAERMEPANRGKLFTPKDAPLILAMGRLHKNKAFDILLEAMTMVPDAYLWLAGAGPLRQELEAQAERLAVKPRVRFLGWREDTAALLAACDIFVCPSRHEPLGNVVIEGWAQGVPVVAADSLGPGTLVDHMNNGVLVPVDDAAQLGRALRGVIEDFELRQRLAEAGYATYLEQFTEEDVVARYLDFFNKLAA